MSSRGKLLALVAPGAVAIGTSTVPWAVEGSTETWRASSANTVPGCSPARVGRLVAAPTPVDHFSTKARSIT